MLGAMEGSVFPQLTHQQGAQQSPCTGAQRSAQQTTNPKPRQSTGLLPQPAGHPAPNPGFHLAEFISNLPSVSLLIKGFRGQNSP
jgi:hypothetical protein